MILIVGQNLAWQKVCKVSGLDRGEVNRVSEMREFASSKGPNVARALRGMGGHGEVICYSGGSTGQRCEAQLAAEGILLTPVRISAETRTCTTLVEGDGTSTEVIEPSPAVTPAERNAFLQVAVRRIGEARVLALMGTAVTGETADCYQALVRAAHKAGVPVLLDSATEEARNALRESPEVLKVNARELGQLAGAGVDRAEDRLSACRELARRFGIRWFLVSRGPHGIEGWDGSSFLQAVPPRVEVRNAIGSGDAAAAGAALVLHDAMASAGTDEVIRSAARFREVLAAATAAGTANCLNPVNGRVERDHYLSLLADTRIIDLSLLPGTSAPRSL
jgi:1-phosphofructokinase family hexose kinase